MDLLRSLVVPHFCLQHSLPAFTPATASVPRRGCYNEINVPVDYHASDDNYSPPKPDHSGSLKRKMGSAGRAVANEDEDDVILHDPLSQLQNLIREDDGYYDEDGRGCFRDKLSSGKDENIRPAVIRAAVPKLDPLKDIVGTEQWEADIKARDAAAHLITDQRAAKKRKTELDACVALPVKLEPKVAGVHVGQLNTMLQTRGMIANYEHDEVIPTIFKATLSLLQYGRVVQVFELQEVCRSKKEAKEKAVDHGIRYLDLTPRPMTNNKSTTASIHFADKSENWLGLLNEYHPARPTFVEYASGPGFACTCTLDPLLSNAVFGSATSTLRSKKDAKTTASKQAVLWLRATGMMAASPLETTPSNDLLRKASTTFAATNFAANSEDNTASYPSRVVALSVALGFLPPSYEWIKNPLVEAFSSCHAIFTSNEAALSGRVGQSVECHGKKAAKNECAKNVLAVLDGIKRARGQEA